MLLNQMASKAWRVARRIAAWRSPAKFIGGINYFSAAARQRSRSAGHHTGFVAGASRYLPARRRAQGVNAVVSASSRVCSMLQSLKYWPVISSRRAESPPVVRRKMLKKSRHRRPAIPSTVSPTSG